MNENISITKENGELLSVSAVSCFSIPDIQKDFLITTANEIDPNGLVILNVSQLVSGKLIKVESEEDWGKIKNIMRSIISSSAGEFKYIACPTTLTSSLDFARNISVQVVAKDQLLKDYAEKKPQDANGAAAAAPATPVVDVPAEVPANPAISGAMPGIGESEVAQGIVEVGPVVETPEVPVAEMPAAPMPEPAIVAPTDLITPAPVVETPAVPVESSVAPVVDAVVAPAETPVVPVAPVMEAPSVLSPEVSTSNYDQVVDEATKAFTEAAKKLVEALVNQKMNK